ncbi:MULTISPECIES: TerB N-terminal domain-containing protein [Xanthomonas]|uniref:tellurite resistance TerB family protein n=1 Tax=Xanthomonas TaxID=338 RepID=UPI002880146C|nr:TerB N-terminal domain-containing protein [Xanthomonas sp. A6251]WNH43836.1 TerB N-terminal domain-containing protein [Xanthomonas sp. A6251]
MIALAIIAMVPKQVWIAIGISLAIALVIYLVVKWQAQKKSAAPTTNEPTLSELIQRKSVSSKSRRPTSTALAALPNPPSLQQEAKQAPKIGVATDHLAAQPTSPSSPAQIPDHRPAFDEGSTASPPIDASPDSSPRPGNLQLAMAHLAKQHDATTSARHESLTASRSVVPVPEPDTGALSQATSIFQPSSSRFGEISQQASPALSPRPASSTNDSASDAPRIIVPTPSRPRPVAAAPAAIEMPEDPDTPNAVEAPEPPLVSRNPIGNLLGAMQVVAARGSTTQQAERAGSHTEEERLTSEPPPIPPQPSLEVSPVPPLPPIPAASHEARATSIPPPLPPAWRATSKPEEELHRTSIASNAAPQEFSLPRPPEGWAQTRWISPDETIEIGGVTISGGLFYTGVRLSTPSGRTEPSLVNAVLAVAPQGNYRHLDGYWNSYADLSVFSRRAYLNWLASDRSDPECAIGYVHLFLFGLERRVLVDGVNEPDSKRDWPAIKVALRQIDAVYGKSYGPIRGYTNGLLDWMALDEVDGKLYTKPLPSFQRTDELPFYLRLALGQCSLDRAPVPSHLALAWARLSPEIPLRTAASRCADEFDQLFVERYQELFGPGLVLPKNRTKLKFSRRPISPAFYGASPEPKAFGETPDVTALSAPIKKLNEIVQQCTDELGPLSRLVGKNPEARHTLDGLLQLPSSIWPTASKAALQSLLSTVQDTTITLPLHQLADRFGNAGGALNREKIRDLARALEAAHIGMEPNLLEGARAPSGADPVVLFALLPGQTHQAQSSAYQTALLTLQLASTVAQADGEFSAHEIEHLGREIDAWSHLSSADHRRLRAHLVWLSQSPITLASLKKKIDPLDTSTKEAIAGSMATLAQVDGWVSPEEMRFLEKVYKALGVETKRVFTDVHAVSTGRSAAPTAPVKQFRLDPKRIAELQQDTAKVSALLAGIFTEDIPEPVTEPVVSALPPKDTTTTPGLLGLDEAHSALLRLMLSRPDWTRAELEDGASDLELMLDGALEHINDASFDAYDIPFSEGDGPVEINPEFIEKIKQ